MPATGYSFRLAPQSPTLELVSEDNQFCVDPGLQPRLYLGLPPDECENECVLGIFPQNDTSAVHVAHLPALRSQLERAPAAYDLLVDTFPGCIPGSQPTTLRMPAALRYGKRGADCDGDGTVRINELMLAVVVALGQDSLSDCVGLDLDDNGMVTVNEIIAAVAAALTGDGA